MTLNALSKEFKEMKTEFKAFSETLQKIAVQETKIELLMQWYDELRRGIGYIQEPRRANVDGEYKR
jgi:predicted CopG family antitoxin